MLKDWKKERHPNERGEIEFWRYKDDYGFVSIYKAEKDSPYYKEGKFFSVEISAFQDLKSKQFKTKPEAMRFAKEYMRTH